MNLVNFSYSNYPKTQPQFRGISREYGKINHSDVFDTYRNDTRMFRNDLDWMGLVKFLQDNFKDKEKVNVYSLASSDGSEAYSFLISLFESIPQEDCAKFLPIYASDQDNVIIEHANNRRINLDSYEITDIKKHTPSGQHYFINPQAPIKIDGDSTLRTSTLSYEPIDKLKKTIKFEKSDILKKVLSIKDEGNTVLMCRNVTPYMEGKYLDTLVDVLKNNFKEGSVLVLGDFDKFSPIEYSLFGTGFIKQMKNVYRKA